MVLSDPHERRVDEAYGKTTTDAACPECEGRLETDGGETACVDCGLLIDEYRFDHGATPRSFPDDGRDVEQTGAPLTPARHDRGLSSEIGFKRDGKGNTLAGGKRRRLSRLRQHHTQARYGSTAERNLAHACSDIARIVGALGIATSTRKEAAVLFRRAQKADLIRGRSVEAMSAASVYAACRCGGVTRTVEDIAAVAQCPVDAVQNSYGVLNRDLGLETLPPRPRDLIPKLVSDCKLPVEARIRAVELAEQARDAGISNGRKPSGVAAACVYLAGKECGHRVSQAELAAVSGTTPVTIRERYREIQPICESTAIPSEE